MTDMLHIYEGMALLLINREERYRLNSFVHVHNLLAEPFL